MPTKSDQQLLWSSPDAHQQHRLTDDGTPPGESGLPIALWSCNVVVARFRTVELAREFAEFRGQRLLKEQADG